MENEKIIKLQFPITAGSGEKIEMLTLGRMKLKHLKTLPKSLFDSDKKKKSLSIDELIPVLCGLTNLPMAVIDEIDLADIETIGGQMESFLSDSLESGKSSSGE